MRIRILHKPSHLLRLVCSVEEHYTATVMTVIITVEI